MTGRFAGGLLYITSIREAIEKTEVLIASTLSKYQYFFHYSSIREYTATIKVV